LAAKEAPSAQLTEENVVAKVAELLETLDQVKKYNALTNALKQFALIVISSIFIFLAVGASIGFLNLISPLEKPILTTAVFALFIPILGIIVGVYLTRKKVNAIKTGEWREELSQGFPSALKILLELDWDQTFDEISSGRVSYAIYGFLKAVAYWIITLFSLSLIGNILTVILLHHAYFVGPFLGLLSFIVVFLFLRKDLLKRYRQIRALDKLLWELRWFSVELRRAEL
jgi:hypothetical protein